MKRAAKYARVAAALAAAAAPGTPSSLGAQPLERPIRPVHTYSIVARDAATGQLGVAVQSHWFSVGSVVPWAESAVGAVATQSFIDPGYGQLGLDLMRVGKSAGEALAGLLAADPHPEVRQVGMVDAAGRTAVHTGEQAIAEACQTTGEGFSVQANLMLRETVCEAMVRAYIRTNGDLAERLMAALEAAEAEGGDIRGRQSAALLVVQGESTGRPWSDRIFDLRVEDHSEPLVELRRLLVVARAYRHMNEGDERVTRGDIDGAVEEYRAAEALLPRESEPIFWHAVTLASVGEVDASLPLFARAFDMRAEWRTLVPRLVDAGLLPANGGLVERIVAAGRKR
ncbi:MAG: DUF1028 domain-containing protein [Gemmatimonadota bacterium]